MYLKYISMLLYTKLPILHYFWIIFPAWIQCFWLKLEGFLLNTFIWFYTRNKCIFIKRNLNASCTHNNQRLACISCVTMEHKQRGSVPPVFLITKLKKIPWILKKYSGFVNLLNEFIIVNAFLGVSREKNSEMLLCLACFACCRLNFYRIAVIPSILYCVLYCVLEIKVDRCTANFYQ